MNTIREHFHHFFIPRHTNNFRARALHLDFLTLYLVLALIMTASVKYMKAHPGNVLGYATNITVDRLYQMTNDERAKNGLSTLAFNNELSSAAAAKAANMFSQGYWAHFGPHGESPWAFITGAGYRYSYAGENLAKNFSDSDGVVNAWMNSPSHRDNILRPVYKEVGFAVVNGTLNGEETTLVVQMFGAPLTAAPTVEAPVKKVAQALPTPTIITPAPTIATQIVLPTKAVFQPATSLARAASVPHVNLMPIYMNINIIFLVIMASTIALDFYFASQMHVVRLSGKNLAHLIFIIFIFLGMLIVMQGSTL